MTLDEIARMVQSAMPGLPIQLVRAHINSAYRSLCSQWQWSFLEGEYTFTTVAPITGTLDTDTMEVTASGVPNPAQVPLHAYVGGEVYRVVSLNNNVVTFSSMYAGETGSAVSITFFRNQYLADATVENLLQMRCGGRRMKEFDQGGVRQYFTGRPTAYRKAGVMNGLMVIELYPIPGDEYVIWYKAKRRIADLSPNESPLVEPQLLLYITLLDLIPTYIGMFPDATYHIKQSAPEWRMSRDRLYGDLLMEDIGRHSTSERVKDEFFTAEEPEEMKVYSTADLG